MAAKIWACMHGCQLLEVILYSKWLFWGERLVHCTEFRGGPLLGGCHCIIGMGYYQSLTGTLSAVGSVTASWSIIAERLSARH